MEAKLQKRENSKRLHKLCSWLLCGVLSQHARWDPVLANWSCWRRRWVLGTVIIQAPPVSKYSLTDGDGEQVVLNTD